MRSTRVESGVLIRHGRNQLTMIIGAFRKLVKCLLLVADCKVFQQLTLKVRLHLPGEDFSVRFCQAGVNVDVALVSEGRRILLRVDIE